MKYFDYLTACSLFSKYLYPHFYKSVAEKDSVKDKTLGFQQKHSTLYEGYEVTFSGSSKVFMSFFMHVKLDTLYNFVAISLQLFKIPTSSFRLVILKKNLAKIISSTKVRT